jgi:hypothetical protein
MKKNSIQVTELGWGMEVSFPEFGLTIAKNCLSILPAKLMRLKS